MKQRKKHKARDPAVCATRQGALPSAGRAPAAQVCFLTANRGVRSAIADEYEAQNAAQAGPKETQRSPWAVSGEASRASRWG
eukprot:6232756-Pyramimonas_sp.AAC.1